MRYWVLCWLCAIGAIAYVQRGALSVPAATIQQELELDEDVMGVVLGGFFLGYAFMQVPFAWVADRLGSRRALALSAIGWSLLTGLAGAATDFWSLFLIWTLMGMVQAALIPCVAKALGVWFGAERDFASGFYVASMPLGTAIVPGLSGLLLLAVAWQHLVMLYAVPGLLWAALFLLRSPEPPRSATASPRPPVDWYRLATNRWMLLLCGQQFLRAAAMVFFLTWFPKYLQATRGVSQLDAGWRTTWAGFGMFIGGLCGGSVSEMMLRWTGHKRLSRQGVSIAGLLACAALTAGSFFVADANLAVLLIALGAGCGTFGGVVIYPVTLEFAGRHVATLFSVINTSGNLGAFLFPIVVGWFVTQTRQWDLVVFLFAGIFVVVAAMWVFINPHGTLFEEDQA
jgi:MFS family permease